MPNNDVNLIVDNEFVAGDESQLFFNGEPVEKIRPDADALQVLVVSGVFSSRNQARSNFDNIKSKMGLEENKLPDGWLEFTAGKLNNKICVLNPTRANLQ